ncbi:MAG: hypothetical protein H6607_09175 [Flavobacteriales bacterium]|nr:hypothetical protein [Flavobacteriales bacterium]
MNALSKALFISILLVELVACKTTTPTTTTTQNQFYPTSKPCTRWWWFATEIKKEDIKYQLDWAKKNNFGGVEVAWVYPLYRYKDLYSIRQNRHYQKDTTAQKWLSPEWSEIVAYTKLYADSIGLACDFTFGSAWPVAGSNIDVAHSTQIYGDTSFRQTLTFAWTWPENQLVINHLDKEAFELFANPIENAMKDALKGSKSALFTDSWEIKLNFTNKIWTPGFDSTFQQKFGYDIIPYMEQNLDSFPDVRYDYMLHLEDYVTNGFYKPYVDKCAEMGAWSRVQCLAAPADIMTLYGMVDIPESEAMLNNPNFSRIVSSAACLASKPVVSSETFTCMYGFHDTYLREEQTADLKIVADALFAQGVNQHFYHGMPYNPKGCDSFQFFATTYFGPGGSLEPELPQFNSYMEKVSGIMQKGTTYSEVAVYLPYEDAVMKGALPPEKRRVWVWGEYELRYIYPNAELEGYHPLWVNRTFLDDAEVKNGKLIVGDAQFSVLYIDVNYMDIRALSRILELAQKGLPICLKKLPAQPGHNKSMEFDVFLHELKMQKNVSENFSEVIKSKPLIEGDTLPAYWCRKEKDGTLHLFLAQKISKNLEYPIYSGMSYMNQSDSVELIINANGKSIHQVFEFKPYQSLMIKIDPKGNWTFEDITFVPKDPIIRPRVKQKSYF